MISSINIEIHTRKVSLKIDKRTAQKFCENVLNILNNEPQSQNVMSFLGACFLYNKLRSKDAQKICVKIPLEYGIMIKTHCAKATRYHELEEMALYNILEQLDKQIKF